jgi:tRNA A-37 threonylcarbamoyl transferase component Bud32
MQDLYSDLVKALAPNIRVLGMAGEGGMALVFVGRDSVLKREVAVKLLSPTLADDAVARKRFTREAEAIAAVSHPNIVNVYHVGEVPGRSIPYFVMQYVDGPTLGMGALQGRMLTELRVRRLMSDVAAGLAAAHRRKVYHRDIKPSNIVLDGETGRALVLDFGISAAYSSRRHSLGRRLTDEGMYLGTPTYMSPEQGAGEEVTGASDVYSLGVLAYELLVGRAPFEGSPVRVMAAHMNETPRRVDEVRSDVSEELSTLIARCLEKSPARRPTAEEIVHFLNPAERQVVEWPPPGMSAVRRAGTRLLSAAAMMSMAVAVFFGAIVVWPELAELRHVGGEPHVLRSFLVGAGLALVFSAASMLGFYALLAQQRWRWAIASGYPRWVVSDVLADSRRDSGNLINGMGEFVLVPGPTRNMLLVFRRSRFALILLGAALALLGIVAWIVAWMRSGGSDAAQSTAMWWAVPILVTYVLFFAAGLPEWRVRRRERGRAARKPAQKAPPLRGELVKMWMASAERARKSLGAEPPSGADKR